MANLSISNSSDVFAANLTEGQTVYDAIAAVFPFDIKVGKGDAAHVVTIESLSLESVLHAMKRGLQEDLNNAKAGLGDEPEEAFRRIEAVANKYATADFTRATGERGPTNNAEVLVRQLAEEAVRAAAAAKGIKLSKDEVKKVALTYAAANKDSLAAEAQRRIDQRKAIAANALNVAGDDLLASLGLASAPTEDADESDSETA